MPPQLNLPLRLRASNLSVSSIPSQRSFTSTSLLSASGASQKNKHRDSYALAQARQRKAANLARQEELRRERAASLGDPVRGTDTPFLQSLGRVNVKKFDRTFSASNPPPNSKAAIPEWSNEEDFQLQKSRKRDMTAPSKSAPKTEISDAERAQRIEKQKEARLRNGHPWFGHRWYEDRPVDFRKLNHSLTRGELESALNYSYALTTPPPSNHTTSDPELESARIAEHIERDSNARVAIEKIVALSGGSGASHRRSNIQHCISYFGRHHTDHMLAPKPASSVPGNHPTKTPRAGPDTGSPEVQIAILTAKIQALARHLAGVGRKDMVNKRNLRILVHKRQKLLQYLRRKERGGERWQHLIAELGLTDATWKGEISL
ncbi:MAG: hypothetical protein M1819_001103 [Sarea resinae]|nr:MAG: hypothetical protein M1819_001103 [Sarea resinae]